MPRRNIYLLWNIYGYIRSACPTLNPPLCHSESQRLQPSQKTLLPRQRVTTKSEAPDCINLHNLHSCSLNMIKKPVYTVYLDIIYYSKHCSPGCFGIAAECSSAFRQERWECSHAGDCCAWRGMVESSGHSLKGWGALVSWHPVTPWNAQGGPLDSGHSLAYPSRVSSQILQDKFKYDKWIRHCLYSCINWLQYLL